MLSNSPRAACHRAAVQHMPHKTGSHKLSWQEHRDVVLHIRLSSCAGTWQGAVSCRHFAAGQQIKANRAQSGLHGAANVASIASLSSTRACFMLLQHVSDSIWQGHLSHSRLKHPIQRQHKVCTSLT